MPYINIRSTKKFDNAEAELLKAGCGKIIEDFRGKNENWLMVDINSNEDMFFRGEKGDCAFIEVKIFGEPVSDETEKFTADMCSLMEKFNIPADRVYVRYEGGRMWGWNGSDF